jgi:signal transduction histidine kinase
MTACARRHGGDPVSERLIATVRIVLAAAALLVVWVDPTQPSVDVPIAYASFVAYLLYSVVVLVVVRAGPRPELPLVTQVLDLVWLAPTLYLTEGANSPFFVFFVVFAFTAAIRWGLRVFWVVTLVCLASYASLLLLSTPTPLDLNNYLMRPAHFLIVGVLGGYLVEYRRRREAELGMLNEAAAAIGTAHGAATAMGLVVEAIARHGLGQIALGCLLDPETEELVLVRGPGEIRRLDDDEAAPFTAALAGAHGEGEARSRALLPVAPALRRLVGADDGVLYPVRVGQRLVGAILVFGRPPRRSAVSGDFLALLLRHVTPHVETLYLLERAREHHVVEERRRIARDLHDSFIQVLAGLGFRLHAWPCTRPAVATRSCPRSWASCAPR